jgi:phosphoglycerate dehydrogenase-like enzyme
LAESVVAAASLHASLEDADVVVLAVPLVPQTANLVDAAFIGRMKVGSILVNVSRGAVVDEAALLQGLTAGRPEHAVLDVCSVEPLPTEHPFWKHPQIALTPHSAGMGSGLVARSDTLFLENLQRFAAGAPLLHEVAGGSNIADTPAGGG